MRRFGPVPALPAWCALLALAALAPAEATMIRCKGADGSITYQDSTCANGARGVPIDPYTTGGARFATEKEINKAMKPEPAEVERKLRAYRAAKPKTRLGGDPAERRLITAGTSEKIVRQRIGDPDYKERATSATKASGGKKTAGSAQHWIYLPAAGDPQTTTTLTVRNGVVTRVERRVTY